MKIFGKTSVRSFDVFLRFLILWRYASRNVNMAQNNEDKLNGKQIKSKRADYGTIRRTETKTKETKRTKPIWYTNYAAQYISLIHKNVDENKRSNRKWSLTREIQSFLPNYEPINRLLGKIEDLLLRLKIKTEKKKFSKCHLRVYDVRRGLKRKIIGIWARSVCCEHFQLPCSYEKRR